MKTTRKAPSFCRRYCFGFSWLPKKTKEDILLQKTHMQFYIVLFLQQQNMYYRLTNTLCMYCYLCLLRKKYFYFKSPSANTMLFQKAIFTFTALGVTWVSGFTSKAVASKSPTAVAVAPTTSTATTTTVATTTSTTTTTTVALVVRIYFWS